MKRKPRFGGAFFTDADALYAFKSRGFGGEIRVVTANNRMAILLIFRLNTSANFHEAY